MKFEYLKDIEQLTNLCQLLISDSNDSAYVKCIKYGRGLESLVRYIYSIKFPKYKGANTELIKLIKDKNFRLFLGNNDIYNKLHFIYIAANNAAFDHDVDDEIND